MLQGHGKLSGDAGVGAMLAQDLCTSKVVLALGKAQWCLKPFIFGIDGSAMFQQQRQQVGIPLPGCLMQGAYRRLCPGH